MNWGNREFDSFIGQDFDQFKRNVLQSIAQEIRSNDDSYILNVNDEEYVSYLTEKYSISPLVIDKNSEEITEYEKVREDMSEYGNDPRYGRYREGYSFTISYNFSGDEQLFHVRPNPYALVSYKLSCDHNQRVSFKIRVYSQDASEFEREKNSAYHSAFANVENINVCVTSFNDGLDSTLKQIFDKYKQDLIKEKNFFKAINLKKTTNLPTTYGVPVITKKKPMAPSCSKENSYDLVPTLDTKTYNDIISEVNQIGKSMERKPSLYLNKDEEGLRDVFVMGLETRFDNISVTGETFNHIGKTDILLKNATDNTNLFIAECKFWHGQKHFQAAIGQLLGYLTWRDSKAALLVFVKGGKFTNIINEIKLSVSSHSCFINYNGNHGETSLSCIFHLPQDLNKNIYLEIIAFDFDKLQS